MNEKYIQRTHQISKPEQRKQTRIISGKEVIYINMKII